jgi:hypothetical protein
MCVIIVYFSSLIIHGFLGDHAHEHRYGRCLVESGHLELASWRLNFEFKNFKKKILGHRQWYILLVCKFLNLNISYFGLKKVIN